MEKMREGRHGREQCSRLLSGCGLEERKRSDTGRTCLIDADDNRYSRRNEKSVKRLLSERLRLRMVTSVGVVHFEPKSRTTWRMRCRRGDASGREQPVGQLCDGEVNGASP